MFFWISTWFVFSALFYKILKKRVWIHKSEMHTLDQVLVCQYANLAVACFFEIFDDNAS